MRITPLAAVVALAPMAGLAHAEASSDRSVRSLYQVCQAEADKPANWCEAYLIGVADTLTAFGAGGHKAGLCAPAYDQDALARIFMAWAPEHQEFWNLDMLAGVQAAFRDQWPCG